MGKVSEYRLKIMVKLTATIVVYNKEICNSITYNNIKSRTFPVLLENYFAYFDLKTSRGIQMARSYHLLSNAYAFRAAG
jgi:hypothetical protein